MDAPFLYSAAGLAVGVLIGLTGVGGGSLMTPVLVLLFGQSPAVAVGTDLVFTATTKVVATASFGYSRRVDWGIVRRLAIGSVPGAVGVILWFFLTRQAPASVDRLVLVNGRPTLTSDRRPTLTRPWGGFGVRSGSGSWLALMV